MAERMLNKGSQFDYRTMRKSIDQYEKIKRTLSNNKRALSTSYVRSPLPLIALGKSKVNIQAKKRTVPIKFEESSEDNPEFIDCVN